MLGGSVLDFCALVRCVAPRLAFGFGLELARFVNALCDVGSVTRSIEPTANFLAALVRDGRNPEELGFAFRIVRNRENYWLSATGWNDDRVAIRTLAVRDERQRYPLEAALEAAL